MWWDRVLHVRPMRLRSLLVSLLLFSCVDKGAIEDEGIDVAADIESKADLKTNTRYVGEVIYGQPLTLAYTRTPRYRSLSFLAPAGDAVDIWVRGGKPRPGHADPDAMVWLYDYTGKLIAMNDDADDTTLDAHLQATLPESNGFYYIYLRDYDVHSETFTVLVNGGHGGGAVADAERAYEAAGEHLEDYKIDPGALPATARATYDKWNLIRHNEIAAYHIGDLFAVALYPEEVSFVDLFDKDGTFLVHGWNGDGGPVPSGWGSYPSWDPTR
jgi:hypothetical protein